MAYKIKSKKLKEKIVFDDKFYRKMYAVDYGEEEGEEGMGTFEIFPSLKEAKKFQKKVNGKLWEANFRKKDIFIEDGVWNYEDNAYLFKNRKNLG